MKATGIVRRIDDLGRVVIPKEIRRRLRIRENDPLEIFVDSSDGIIFKKYSPIFGLGDQFPEYAAALHRSLGCSVLICDRDIILAAAGSNKNHYMEKAIHADIEKVIVDRSTAVCQNKDVLNIITESDNAGHALQIIAPIWTDGDPVGAIILLSGEPKAELLEHGPKSAEMMAGLLSRLMSD